MSYFIPILLGSARDGRLSDKAAAYVVTRLKEHGVETQLVDVRDLHTTTSTERKHPEPWASIMKRADGLIIVSPEYNHGYPGVLKETLDSCYEEYFRKPVSICGCSAGGLGGARVVEQLREVMVELHMVATREAVYFSNHVQLWNEDGSITDPSYADRLKTMFDELLWYVQVLKQGRDTVPFPTA